MRGFAFEGNRKYTSVQRKKIRVYAKDISSIVVIDLERSLVSLGFQDLYWFYGLGKFLLILWFRDPYWFYGFGRDPHWCDDFARSPSVVNSFWGYPCLYKCHQMNIIYNNINYINPINIDIMCCLIIGLLFNSPCGDIVVKPLVHRSASLPQLIRPLSSYLAQSRILPWSNLATWRVSCRGRAEEPDSYMYRSVCIYI